MTTENVLILLKAKRFAKAMKASLIFSSTSHSINVQKVSILCLQLFSLSHTPSLFFFFFFFFWDLYLTGLS